MREVFVLDADSIDPVPDAARQPSAAAFRAGRSLAVCLVAAGFALVHSAAAAQVRGMPIFFEPAYPYDARAGIDIGHGGETDGFTMVAGASVHFAPGNCRRFSLAGSGGFWNPPGPTSARFTGAAGVQVLINPCPSPLHVSAITFRLITGLGIVDGEESAAWSAPVGIGAGWKLAVPIAHLEPWIVPHMVYRESLGNGDSRWTTSLSLGFNVGVGELLGLRIGTQCCIGGLAAAYGLSLWF
jgi:hypothetical protein